MLGTILNTVHAYIVLTFTFVVCWRSDWHLIISRLFSKWEFWSKDWGRFSFINWATSLPTCFSRVLTFRNVFKIHGGLTAGVNKIRQRFIRSWNGIHIHTYIHIVTFKELLFVIHWSIRWIYRYEFEFLLPIL
jgi:hypothetical protein